MQDRIRLELIPELIKKSKSIQDNLPYQGLCPISNHKEKCKTRKIYLVLIHSFVNVHVKMMHCLCYLLCVLIKLCTVCTVCL